MPASIPVSALSSSHALQPRAAVRRKQPGPPLTFWCALAVLAALTSSCFAAPLVEWAMGIDAQAVNIFQRYAPASADHWLGTDELGRDILARLLYGGQVSLFVGFAGAIGAAALGTAIGLTSGYLGGNADAFLMRATDTVIALPVLPLLLIVAALDLTKLGLPDAAAGGAWRIVVIVVLFGWPTVARVARATTLSARQRTYVMAAQALGISGPTIVVRHILPNVAGPIIVASTLAIGNIILAESILSFLGLGIQPPTPSWGNMLTNAQETLTSSPQLAIYPGLLIFVVVVAFNVLGDGLQRWLDRRRI